MPHMGLALSVLPRAGIQHAWGDASTLISSAGIPSDIVIFDAPNVVLPQTFTPDETQSPGLANSAIEIMANDN
ncbi:hypothetical protein PUATCC27989T_05614 [Phytobacter ursingii]|nr:hypothetical protein PUATCC27989T_05614 [Phytobacter ursingii]